MGNTQITGGTPKRFLRKKSKKLKNREHKNANEIDGVNVTAAPTSLADCCTVVNNNNTTLIIQNDNGGHGNDTNNVASVTTRSAGGTGDNDDLTLPAITSDSSKGSNVDNIVVTTCLFGKEESRGTRSSESCMAVSDQSQLLQQVVAVAVNNAEEESSPDSVFIDNNSSETNIIIDKKIISDISKSIVSSSSTSSLVTALNSTPENEPEGTTQESSKMDPLKMLSAVEEKKDISEKNDGAKENLIKSGTLNSFTVTKHRRVELTPTKLHQKNNYEQNKPNCRHSSLTDSPESNTPVLESNVLRKVASLTLDKATIEHKTPKSKFIPEKLDLQFYEKFEGQVLINSFSSAAMDKSRYNGATKPTADVQHLVSQICTQLLSAGVIQQIIDKDAAKEDVFKPNLMYFWAHGESTNAAPMSPGRLSATSWPPNILETAQLDEKITNKDAKNLNSDYITILSEKLSDQKKINAELQFEVERLKQELECSKTVLQIQALTEKAKLDFQSPIKTETKLTNGFSKNTENDDCNNNIVEKCEVSDILSCGQTTTKILPSNSNETAVIKIPDKATTSNNNNKSSQNLNSTQKSPYSSRIPVSAKSSTIDKTRRNSLPIQSQVDSTEIDTSPCNSISENNKKPIASHIPVKNSLSHPGIELPKHEFNSKSSTSPKRIIGDQAVTATSPISASKMPIIFPTKIDETVSAKSVAASSEILTTAHSDIPKPPPPPPPPPASAFPMPSGIPPPPPPMPLGIPPPPPVPFGIPPVPPLITSNNNELANCSIGVPPPPPVPGSAPSPFPTPPIGGWNAQRATFRKQPVTPKVPMKPLYWNRLVSPPLIVATPSPEQETSFSDTKLLWDEIEEPPINEEEFISLFSRQVTERKIQKKSVEKKVPKVQTIKVLDSKRSQNVGILASSLHLEFSEIENAIYNFDTSVISSEVLQQIYDVRATEEEISLIKNHVAEHPNQPLDKPEQFLLDLSRIPYFAERTACFVFQSEYVDLAHSICFKLCNIRNRCEFMISSESLKKVLGIILALGNFMNGGNLQRGQADGFGLDILPKLKDVKSKDNSLTLMHYIVRMYLKSCEDPAMCPLPIPEPHDVIQASAVNFDDISLQLENLNKNINDCYKKMDIITSETDTDQAQKIFRDKMLTFLEAARKTYNEQMEVMEESKKLFASMLKFYHFNSKSISGGEEPTPKTFFSLWVPFCTYFNAIWQTEQSELLKARLKETRLKEQERRKQITKTRRSDTGLKSFMMKNLSNNLNDEE